MPGACLSILALALVAFYTAEQLITLTHHSDTHLTANSQIRLADAQPIRVRSFESGPDDDVFNLRMMFVIGDAFGALGHGELD